MWVLFGRLADIAVLSLLWTICSLPVITAGAASAALMRTVMNMNTGEGNWRARHYFRYLRSNFRTATPMWLVFLLAAAVLAADLFILRGADGLAARVQRIAAVLGLILWLLIAVWAFTLTSLFEGGLVQTVKNAFYFSISWLPRTMVMAALLVLPIGLAVFVPAIMSRIVVLWPALFCGGTAYICSRLMVGPLTPYLGLGEEADDDGRAFDEAAELARRAYDDAYRITAGDDAASGGLDDEDEWRK